ncbi:spore germination protein GerPC [Paenibacillus abyssi]|uniref:Germination protein PC n=1 Tax=Paenibacillus abyssi TaxID=1340531 RepID=A0A917FUF3_9BACL|nr:spore germination protein GerPC [Paenibacillus abyssi]GGG09811.1 germination protein PC [Paenibacillus abyssi]
MDPYQYVVWLLNEMHKTLTWQTNKITQMENELAKINEQLASLAALPRTNVEKIEYNFEQLKVEQLDGTLIIGISPTDAGTIEDLDVQNHHEEDVPLGEQTSDTEFRQIKHKINGYIRESIPEMLDKQALERDIALIPAEKEAILEDMIRQIDDRIRIYLQHFQGDKQIRQEWALEHNVLQKLKRDVHTALDSYLAHFGGNEKE